MNTTRFTLIVVFLLILLGAFLVPIVIDSKLKENNTGWIEIPAPEAYEGEGPCLVWETGGVWCH